MPTCERLDGMVVETGCIRQGTQSRNRLVTANQSPHVERSALCGRHRKPGDKSTFALLQPIPSCRHSFR
jgi:hypothetical protein